RKLPTLYKQLSIVQTLINQHNKIVFTDIDAAVRTYNEILVEHLSTMSSSLQQSWHQKLSLVLCPRVRSYLHVNPHMPIGSIMTQTEIAQLATELEKFPDITVIDDITYYELILSPSNQRPGTFA
ncbi:MAG TPA: hypothetical protein PLD88_08335, partial [Candidatus Berkiella sp.]|nr:hypothetical protein [Candidatus Berkiella sp.]